MTRRYWTLRHSDAVMMQVHHLSVDCTPPRIRFRNADAFVDYLENDWQTSVDDPLTGRRLLAPPPPTVELEITEPGFAPHLFIHEALFVSAALREAMALHPDDAQWFPVDARWSTPEVQARGYAMLHPTCMADPIDHARSEGRWLDVRGPEGEESRIWVSEAPEGEYRPARYRWREDFVPPAPLFTVDSLALDLVTDELAERVRRGGFDDVALVDPTADRADHIAADATPR